MTNDIRINFILEIIGQPKQHIKTALDGLLDDIDQHDNITVRTKDVSDPEQTEDDFWAVFADIDATVTDITTVGHIANNYNPASIELVEPATVEIKRKDFNDLFADTLAKLHINNTQIQKLKSVKEDMTRNINALVRNAVLLSLEQDDKTKEEIADDIGVSPDDLDELLSTMEDENRLRHDDGEYTIRA
jgi:tRNA A58 N-methylase Trm61